MELLLLGTHQILCKEWRTAFEGVEGVQVVQSNFQSLLGQYDCLVSPANSFGLMDGGIDAAITDVFRSGLEHRVQDEIWRVYRGQQPVGTCLMVETRDSRCPWLAHCPTMPIPMKIEGTSNAYAALLAALTTAEVHGIQTLACPGLGTGAGNLPAAVAARQMRYAFDVWRGPRFYPTWPRVSDHMCKSSGVSRREYLLSSLSPIHNTEKDPSRPE